MPFTFKVTNQAPPTRGRQQETVTGSNYNFPLILTFLGDKQGHFKLLAQRYYHKIKNIKKCVLIGLSVFQMLAHTSSKISKQFG